MYYICDMGKELKTDISETPPTANLKLNIVSLKYEYKKRFKAITVDHILIGRIRKGVLRYERVLKPYLGYGGYRTERRIAFDVIPQSKIQDYEDNMINYLVKVDREWYLCLVDLKTIN